MWLAQAEIKSIPSTLILIRSSARPWIAGKLETPPAWYKLTPAWLLSKEAESLRSFTFIGVSDMRSAITSMLGNSRCSAYALLVASNKHDVKIGVVMCIVLSLNGGILLTKY